MQHYAAIVAINARYKLIFLIGLRSLDHIMKNAIKIIHKTNLNPADPVSITSALNQVGIVIASRFVVNLYETILLVGNKSGFIS